MWWDMRREEPDILHFSTLLTSPLFASLTLSKFTISLSRSLDSQNILWSPTHCVVKTCGIYLQIWQSYQPWWSITVSGWMNQPGLYKSVPKSVCPLKRQLGLVASQRLLKREWFHGFRGDPRCSMDLLLAGSYLLVQFESHACQHDQGHVAYVILCFDCDISYTL